MRGLGLLAPVAASLAISCAPNQPAHIRLDGLYYRVTKTNVTRYHGVRFFSDGTMINGGVQVAPPVVRRSGITRPLLGRVTQCTGTSSECPYSSSLDPGEILCSAFRADSAMLNSAVPSLHL